MSEVDDMIETDIDQWVEDKHVRHMTAFLEGVRCGFLGHGKPVSITLTWDTVTCPACLAKKRPEEPWTQEIDTRGD